MNKESSAILVHACGVDEVRPDFPDTVARQSALAAAEMYRQDRENTYLVINAGMHECMMTLFCQKILQITSGDC